jgi:hypothetical protein
MISVGVPPLTNILTRHGGTVQGCELRRDVLSKDLANCAGHIEQGTLEDIRRQCQQRGVCETDRVVALCERLSVEYAPRQVGQINASKAVDRTHVATDGESFRNLKLKELVFDGVSWNGVVDANRAAVPVLATREQSAYDPKVRREIHTECARFLSCRTTGPECRSQRRTI